MYELADIGFSTATDLADYLVKNNSISFRDRLKPKQKFGIKLVQYESCLLYTSDAADE